VTGRPQAQLRLNRVIEASYGDARHIAMISLQSHRDQETRGGPRSMGRAACGPGVIRPSRYHPLPLLRFPGRQGCRLGRILTGISILDSRVLFSIPSRHPLILRVASFPPGVGQPILAQLHKEAQRPEAGTIMAPRPRAATALPYTGVRTSGAHS
jgi:hypothetical protein